MGEQQQREAEPREGEGTRGVRVTSHPEQRNAGWLARWRERRRNNSARAADISRRSVEAERRNIDNSFKYGGSGR